MIKDAFAYPLRGNGAAMMFLGTGAVFFIWMSLWWLPLFTRRGVQGFAIMFIGYLAVFCLDVIHVTVIGGRKLPELYSTSSWDDYGLPIIRAMGAILVAATPVLAVLFAGLGGEAFDLLVLGVAALMGIFYLPMALANAAVVQTFSSVLPHEVLPSILRCMPSYLWSALLFLTVAVLGYGSQSISLLLPYTGRILSSLLIYYFLVVASRLIGTIYRKHYDKLDV